MIGVKHWLIYTGLLILGIGTFLKGLIEIDVAHKGVPKILGKRTEKIELDEGYHWLPPKIISAEEVSIKEQTKDVAIADVVSDNNVSMSIDTSIQYLIIDPYQSLSIGESVISDGLEEITKRTLRIEARAEGNTDSVLMNMTEDLGIKVRDAIVKRNEAEGARESLEVRWGIRVLNVFVTKIFPTDPNVLDAYENEVIEKRQKEAETTERNFNVESIEAYKETGLSAEAAAAMHAGERGKKVGVNVRVIQVNKDDPLTNAAAVVSDGLAEGGTPKGGE